MTIGLMAGLADFIATNWPVFKGGPVVAPHLGLLAQFFPGYRVTFPRSLIGFAYGFVWGFIGGYFLVPVYNLIAVRCQYRP